MRSARRRPSPLPRFDPATAAVIERGFTEGVAERIRRGPFTFSDRAALLAAGQRLGIDRFRANLIVAEQQHRAPRRHPTPGRPRRIGGRGAAIAAVVAVQGGLVAAAVWAWMA